MIERIKTRNQSWAQDTTVGLSRVYRMVGWMNGRDPSLVRRAFPDRLSHAADHPILHTNRREQTGISQLTPSTPTHHRNDERPHGERERSQHPISFPFLPILSRGLKRKSKQEKLLGCLRIAITRRASGTGRIVRPIVCPPSSSSSVARAFPLCHFGTKRGRALLRGATFPWVEMEKEKTKRKTK